MKNIDRNSKIPLYKQLKRIIAKYIDDELDVGDFIPTEKEFIEEFKLSRITVRKAIDELVTDGILIKTQGKGTHVQSKKITQNISSINSWTEDMKQKNISTKTISTDIKIISPSYKLKKELKLKNDEQIIRLQRIREVDNEPAVIMINYLKRSLIPNFLIEEFNEESWYNFLENKYNIIFIEAIEKIKARLSTPVESDLLNIHEGDAVLSMRRVSFIKGGVPAEVVEVIARGDRYQYSIKLKGE